MASGIARGGRDAYTQRPISARFLPVAAFGDGGPSGALPLPVGRAEGGHGRQRGRPRPLLIRPGRIVRLAAASCSCHARTVAQSC